MTLVLITSATPFLRLALTSPVTFESRRKDLLNTEFYRIPLCIYGYLFSSRKNGQ